MYKWNKEQWLETFAKRLSHTIAYADMTQVELSEKTGISEATISRYVNRKRIPRLKEVIIIANALDVTIDYLINF